MYSCKNGENTTAGLRGSCQDQNGNFVKESPPRSIARGQLMALFGGHTGLASRGPRRQTPSSGDARMYRSAYTDTEAIENLGYCQPLAHSYVQPQNDITSCKNDGNTTAGTVGLRGSSLIVNGNFVEE